MYTEVVIKLNGEPINFLNITVGKYQQLLAAVLEDAKKIVYQHNHWASVELSVENIPERFDKIELHIKETPESPSILSEPSKTPQKILPAQLRTLRPFIPSIPFFGEEDVVQVEYKYPHEYEQLKRTDTTNQVLSNTTPKRVDISESCQGGHPCSHSVLITEHDGTTREEWMDSFTIWRRYMNDMPFQQRMHFHEKAKIPSAL